MAVRVEAQRRLGVVLAEHQCDELAADLEMSRRIGQFYQTLADELTDELQALKQQGATPPPVVVPQVERPLGSDFDREGSAIVWRFWQDMLKANPCCESCAVGLQAFFAAWLARYLSEN